LWDDSSFGNVEILYRRSTDGGMTFGPTENLSNTPEEFEEAYPYMARIYKEGIQASK
jgi:hypothetical protein